MPEADCGWQPPSLTASKLFSLTFNLFMLDWCIWRQDQEQKDGE